VAYLRDCLSLGEAFSQGRDSQNRGLFLPLDRLRRFLASGEFRFSMSRMRFQALVTFVSVVGQLYSPVLGSHLIAD
jgi:hypothetical protein